MIAMAGGGNRASTAGARTQDAVSQPDVLSPDVLSPDVLSKEELTADPDVVAILVKSARRSSPPSPKPPAAGSQHTPADLS